MDTTLLQKAQGAMNEAVMMRKLVERFKKYHVNPQILNTLRFSAQRFDVSRSDQIAGKNFKDLYRHINVRMSHADEQLFFNYLMLNGPSNPGISVTIDTSAQTTREAT